MFANNVHLVQPMLKLVQQTVARLIGGRKNKVGGVALGSKQRDRMIGCGDIRNDDLLVVLRSEDAELHITL